MYVSTTNGPTYIYDLLSETIVDSLEPGSGTRGLGLLRSHASWVSEDTGFVSVPAGDSATITVSLSSTGLSSGVHQSYLFTCSNDTNSVIDSIPIQLTVNGLAILDASDSCLLYDTVFQYSSTDQDVTIYNDGCDTLNVSGITAGLSEYSASPSSFTVYPGDSQIVTVTFTTNGTGSFPTTLSVTTDANDTTICLQAYSVQGPSISFTPQTINAYSDSCDDTLYYPINIYNTGAANLSGTLFYSDFQIPTLQDVLDSLNSNYQSVTAQVPSIYNFTDAPATNYISDGGGDMYDGANRISTDIGGYIDYTGNAISTSAFFGSGSEYFTFKGTGLWVMAADLNGVDEFNIYGNLGADGSGSIDTAVILDTIGNKVFRGFVSRVYGAGDPSINHLIIVENDVGMYQSTYGGTALEDHSVFGLGGQSRIYYLLYARTSGGYIDNASTKNIMSSFIQLIHTGSELMVLDTFGVDIPGGDSQQVQLMVHTTNVLQGTYQEWLVFNTNDPVNPIDSIEVNLVFDGYAIPDLSDSCLYFDTVFQFGSTIDSFYITNEGCDTLIIDSVYSDASARYTIQYDTSNVFPGDTVYVYVTFNPDSAGTFNDSLWVVTDLITGGICLNGVALPPPTIEISPTVIDTIIYGCDDTLLIPVEIVNSGQANLEYSSYESGFNTSMILDSVLSRLVNNSGDVSNVIPNRHNFTEGVTGNRIFDGSLDMYDYGNYLYTNLGSYINYSNNVIATSSIVGSGGQYFTHKGTGLFVFAADLDNVYGFYTTGGTGHDNNSVGSVDTMDLWMDYAGITYQGFVRQVYGETEPSVNHLTIIAYDSNSNVYDYSDPDVWDDRHYLYDLNDIDRLYYLAFGSLNGGYITRNQMMGIMREFLGTIHGGDTYLDLNPEEDTIAPGDTTNATLMLTSTGLVNGVYDGFVVVTSNDPQSPADTILITLEVDGEAEIAFSDSACLETDTTFQFGTFSDSLIVFNIGCDTMIMDTAFPSQSHYSFTYVGDTLVPGDSIEIYYDFSPLTAGTFNDTFYFQTSIGDTFICIDGYAIPPPTVSVAPTSIDTIVYGCDDTLQLPFTVYNTGSADLIYTTGESVTNPDLSLDSVLSRLVTGSQSISDLIPNRHNFTTGVTSYYINDGGSDMFDNGNFLYTNLGSYLYYSNNTITTSGVVGSSGQYFTHKGTGLFVMAADLDGVSNFYVTGGTGHDVNGQGTVDTLDLLMNYGGTLYQGFVRRVYGETEPSVHRIIIIEYDSNAYDYSDPDVYDDRHYVYNLSNTSRIYNLLFGSTSGGQISRSQLRSIMAEFFQVIYGNEEWKNISIASDTIAPGDSTQGTITLSSTGLNNGTYPGYFTFNTNDPLTPVDSIQITFEVDGQPEISFVDTACLYTDSVFQFGTFEDSLTIYNLGCDTLLIDSLYSSYSAFSISVDTTSIIPGDSTTLRYVFSPLTVGAATDTLYINNNDTDTFLCVDHIAIAPPTISVTPTLIDTTIVGCDDTIWVPVTVYNTGAADLTLDVTESSLNSNMSLDSVLSRVVNGSSSISNLIPNRHNFTEGVTSIRIADGGSDMFDFGNYLYTNLSSYLNYSNNTIATSAVVGSNGQYFTHKGTGLFVMAADLDGVNNFYITGGTGHDNNSEGTVDTLDLLMNYAGTLYQGFVRRVYDETEPSVHRIIIIEYDSNVYDYSDPDVWDDRHYVYNLSNTSRIYNLLFGSTNGGLITRNQLRSIMGRFLAVIHGGEPWMKMIPATDTIVPGDSLNALVELTSTGLTSGTYTGYFSLNSNDPVTPVDSIEIILDIVGTPEWSVNDSCIWFDTIMQYTDSVDSFYVYNTGCDTLDIDSTYNLLGYATLDINDTSIAPNDSVLFYITFAPTDTGDITDSLYFQTNAGTHAICAYGRVYPPPVISSDTDSVSITVYGCCDTLSYPVTVYNTGLSDLYVNIEQNYGNTLQQVLSRWQTNSASVTGVVPSAYNFTDWPASNYISDGGGDMYDGGNRINTNITSTISYSNNSITNSTSFGTGGAYFTSKVDGMWIMAADLNSVTSFSITGNLGADGSGSYQYSTVSYTHQNVTYTGFIKRVYGAGDPSVNHLIIVPNATGVTHTGSTSTDNDYHIVNGLDSTSRIYYLLYAGTSGLLINDANALNIMTEFLTNCVSADMVISVTPDPDTIAPSDSTVFSVAVNTCGGDSGVYYQPIQFNSNDPLTSQHTVMFEIIKEDLPSAPIINDTAICFGDPLPTFTAIGQNIRWYDDSLLTNLVDTGSTLDSSMSAVGTYVFYSTQTIDSCEGFVDTFTFVINTPPASVSANDTFACESGIIPDLVANGNNVYWFSDSTLSVPDYVGDTFSTGESTFGFYTYFLYDSVTGCPPSAVDTVVLFIDSVPGPPSGPDSIICISDSVPTLFASGDSVRWYSDPGLTSLLGTGNFYTPIVAVPGNYNHYVVQVDTLTECYSNYEVITLSVLGAPLEPVANNDTACFGGTIPPLVASGSNLVWYSDSALTVIAGTGDSLFTGQTAVGAYTYFVTQNSGTCEGNPDTAVLVISAPPSTPVALDTFSCFGDPVPDLTANTTGLRWYSDTGLTTLEYAGDTFSTGQSAAGTYTYYVTQNSGGCEGAADTSELIINALPSTPNGQDTIACFGQTIPKLYANGSNNQWYSDSTLLTLVGTGDSLTTGQTAVGAYTYYVTELDSVTGCESSFQPVTLTINTAPAQPSVGDTSVCETDSIPVLIATGNFISWFSDSLLTNNVFNGDTFNTGESTPGVYTYYLRDSLTGCPPGPADTVVLTINSSPATPSVPDSAICYGTTLPEFVDTVGGFETEWYSDPGLITLINTGDTFATTDSTVGTYTYFIVHYDSNTGCYGEVDSATLTIYGVPPTPTMQDSAFCVGSSEVPLTATGTNIRWYSDTGLTTQVGTGDSLFTGQSTVGSYTYYATQGLNSCESAADSATLTIHPIPAAVLASDSSICEGDTIPALTSSGLGVEWYSDTSLLTLVGTGASFTQTADSAGTYNYYVVQYVNNCQSLPDTSTLVINPAPAAPIGIDTGACEAGTIPDLGAIGSNIIWYSDTGLTVQVDTGMSYSTGQTTPGSYSYYVTQTVSGCEGPADTATLSIYTSPAVPVTSDSTICEGDSIPQFTASGVSPVWTDTAGSILAFGNSFTPNDSVAGTYLYLVRDSLFGCPASSPDTATLEIIPAPAIPITSDTAICFGQTTPDLIASGQNIEWFSDSALTTLVDTGSSYSTGQTAVGTYTYFVRQTTSNCPGPATAITLTIAPIAVAPSAPDTSICDGDSVILVSSGTNLRWYSDSTLSTLVGVGDSLVLSGLGTGANDYYLTDSFSNCPASAPDTATVFVQSLPVAPSVSDTSICFGDSVPGLVAVGGSITWYLDSNLTVVADTGNTYVPNDTAVGQHPYFATQMLLGCEGNADTAVLTINAIPAAPLATDTAVCVGSTIPDLEASGTNLIWYSDSALTTQVDTGSSFSTGQTAVGSYTYYVTQSQLDCESPSAMVTLTIDSLPAAAQIADTTICEGETTPTFNFVASNVEWRSDTSLTVIATGASFTPSISSPGTYTYIVSQSVNDCESPNDTFSLIINATPAAPITLDTSICSYDSVPSLTSSGIGLSWYSDSGLTTLVDTGSTYATGMTAVGTYTYYVTQTILGCEGPWTSSTLQIDNPPSAPSVSDQTICESDSQAIFTQSGLNYWYDDSLYTNLLDTGDSFIVSNPSSGLFTYYVRNLVGGCFSLADTFALTVNATPVAPTALDTAACEGGTIPNLTAAGTGISWYNDPNLDTLAGTGTSLATGLTASGVHDFYVTQTISGCEGPADTSYLIIYSLPTIPLVSNDTICEGETTPTLTATGTSITWYDDAALTNVVDTGLNFTPTQSAAGSYTFYATQSVNGCEGPADSLVLLIQAVPATPIATDTTFCYGTGSAVLNSSGTGVTWYQDTGLTTVLTTGSSYSPTLTAFGTYNYYVTQSINGCESEADTSTVEALDAPPAPSIADSSICLGDSIPVFLSGTGLTYWYDNPAATSAIDSGDSFQPAVTSAGTYTYYARNISSNCESNLDTFQFVINALTASPSISNATFCEGDTGILIGSGANLQWYGDSGLTNLLFTGDTFNTGIDTSGNYSFFVTQDSFGCASPADTVSLAILSAPGAPAALDTGICVNESPLTLFTSGSNVNWYSDPSLDSLIDTGATHSPGSLAAGVYSFYVTQTVAGCEGGADTLTYSVLGIPSPPDAFDTAICDGEVAPSFFANGAGLTWYSDTALQSIVGTGPVFDTNLTAVGTYNFYVTQSTGSCESNPDTATLTIYQIPQAPVIADQSVCHGNSPSYLVGSGTSLVWYDNSSMLIPIGAGDSLQVQETAVGTYFYYATELTGVCESSADTIAFTIHPNPLVTLNTYDETILSGDSVHLEAFNAQSYVWSPPTDLTNTSGAATTASPSVSTVYTVTGTNEEGCSNDTSVSINVMPLGLADALSDLTKFNLYPNPTQGLVEIELGAVVPSDYELTVINSLGELVYSSHIHKESFDRNREWKNEIDLREEAAGVYVVSVFSDSNVQRARLVIQ